ncbi:MAG TPA: hypothetical protein DCG24_10370 [Bacteroidetes bacterium]|nr:hypothetical protein [Bacteroidota bacterium]
MPKKTNKETRPGFMRFLISKAFWLNLVLAGVFVFLTAWITLGLINRYSRHSESQTVPDLTGLPATEAERVLEQAGLKYAVMDSSYLQEATPLSIISQEPKPGSMVKEGRTIYAVVNRAAPPPTELPYIEQGTSYISVVEILQSRGLRIGNISYKPFQYKDVFLDMRVRGVNGTPKPGTKIPKGSIVDLVLGNGLGETRVEIPDLVGLSYLEASALIQLKELNVGTVVGDGAITDTMSAFIVRQYPAPYEGGTINMGSMVDIWISDLPPATQDQPENDMHP